VGNVACANCNSRFFSALQRPSDPFLRSALAGELSTLDTDLKKALASWLILLRPIGPRDPTRHYSTARISFPTSMATGALITHVFVGFK
jgi:hypothetical protein